MSVSRQLPADPEGTLVMTGDHDRPMMGNPLSHWENRVDATDWAGIRRDIDSLGCALTGPLLSVAEASEITSLYEDDARFRSTIDMSRYRFGEGEYRYFDHPHPEPLAALKRALYPKLLPIARDWWGKLGREAPWPDTLDEWVQMCHAAGQTKSTMLLLRYGPGDWNALHRDLYGNLVFPLQVVVNLTNPGVDHTGGEFLLYEQRPRAQSRGTATVIPHGHGLVFTTGIVRCPLDVGGRQRRSGTGCLPSAVVSDSP